MSKSSLISGDSGPRISPHLFLYSRYESIIAADSGVQNAMCSLLVFSYITS